MKEGRRLQNYSGLRKAWMVTSEYGPYTMDHRRALSLDRCSPSLVSLANFDALGDSKIEDHG